MEKARTEAFSDGVFAIAITLLVLEFRVPEGVGTTNRELTRALLHLWPSLLAFFVSFASILVMWINHHGLFTLFQRTHHRVWFANGLLLLLVTFIPFPTALVARHLNDSGAEAAAVVYCATYVLINVAYHLLLSAITTCGVLRPEVTSHQIKKIRTALWIGTAVYIAAAAIACLSGLAGVIICSILWIMWARLDYRDQPAPPQNQ